ncbi:hypothetical protein [Enterococcus wangshanyuanii]|uniref:SipW-cognate class signal peptide n=1 Tax=Enterococcus wangshanyuanii TaxID=2005703 RepID=A0ABQ1NJ31_9ENTE|nr:hypothetical protein [Enterococcus wangshanyuanii]GGC78425.1 hypothetical protein GCM10011573_05160 [Enterococcus wangshanyuanii]
MKKKMVILLCGITLLAGISSLGGLYAYAYGWIIVGENGELQYETVDQASIEIYSEVSHSRSHENGKWLSTLKPKDLVKSVKDRKGNEVDYSNLEVSFKVYDKAKSSFVDISENEVLNTNGTFNFDKFNDFQVTFKYTYNSMPGTQEKYVLPSTISKTVDVWEAGA